MVEITPNGRVEKGARVSGMRHNGMLGADIDGLPARSTQASRPVAPPTPSRVAMAVILLCSLGLEAPPARADMALSKVVVDFTSARPTRDDIEISNSGDDILYVSVEPSEILNPGRPDQQRVANPNPRQLGLLISPN